MSEVTGEVTIESLQQQIEVLNQKLADAANQADAHQQELNDALHQVDIVKEEFSKQIDTIKEEHNEKCQNLINDANKAIDVAQKMAAAYRDLWESQNIYVITLEKQAVGDMAAAIQQHEAAKRALQIQILQSQG